MGTIYVLSFVLLLLEVNANAISWDNEVAVYEPVLQEGCSVEPSSELTHCIDQYGNSIEIAGSKFLPSNATCIAVHGNQDFPVACVDGVYTVSLPKVETSMRIKRQAFTMLGAGIGEAFGPVGAAVGAGIGLIADIVCWIFCRKRDPPTPNKQPIVATPAELVTATPIIAAKGKTDAPVKWKEPAINDDEDGSINVITSPETFKNGGTYSEGSYIIYFAGTDSGRLSTTTYLTFEVKVDRCRFQTWPDNGDIDCKERDIIFGTSCKIKCNSGYKLGDGDKSTIKCQEKGLWSPLTPPDCIPIPCASAPVIEHGVLQCINNKMEYDNPCVVTCDEGYRVNGLSIMVCDTNGAWGSTPVCKDVLPPRLVSCPNDMQVYIDSLNNTAKAEWLLPEAVDNSKEPPSITEKNNYKPGQRFTAGSHTVKYTIVDGENNVGYSCVFILMVLTISCSPPDLRVTGGDHLKYDCPDSYSFGAECSLACKSGYPMGGVDVIQCLKDSDSYPPKLDWTWETGGLAPFCKETNCSRDALNEPINGALACSAWTHGQFCQMQCNDEFDIPNIGDGMYVCGKSTGKWRPTSRVPDCSDKLEVNNMHLPNEFYYYTGNCNSSVQTINDIQEGFVAALNSSNYLEVCVGVPECQAKFVDVTCGPISSRRKRDIHSHLNRRSASQFAYMLHFELILPYTAVEGKSSDEIFYDNEDLLYAMSDVIQTEVDAGHFDLNIDDVYVDVDSYGPGMPAMQCPTGTIPRIKSATCVGCPKGIYSTTAGRCVECPLGSYQDSANSIECEPCPTNTNTTETGSENVTQCLEYCAEGEFSPNTLAPCTKCPSNAYQPNDKSTSCIRCDANKRTLRNGATEKSQCRDFDVQLSATSAIVENRNIHDVITMSMWVYVTKSETIAAVDINNSTTHSGLSVGLMPSIVVRQNGDVVNTGQSIPPSTWTNVAISIDKAASEVELYVNGKVEYRNDSVAISKAHVLDSNDLIELHGDMKLSALNILPRKASASEISSWASTCVPAITGAIISMDDIAEADDVTVLIPSVCDALDECVSSPCGMHTCINKLGNYECLCTGGYTGRQCQIQPDFCNDNNCKHGSTCVNGMSNYTCQCTYGSRGDLCQIKAVDGQWSGWSTWTSCSESCGGGLATRIRRCDSPPPDPEGNACPGNSSESTPCKQEKCPECSDLRRSYGVIITCNDTSELKRCTISCRPGLYFSNPPLPYYECGLATGYNWNHQNNNNPTGRLPACSELLPPKEIGIEFDGVYESIECKPDTITTVTNSLEAKLSGIDCKKAGTCETTIKEPVCLNSKKKRSIGGTLTITIGMHASVHSSGGTLDVAGLLQNNTAPSEELIDLVRLTMELEKSAQKLINDSVNFFQVTIDGTNHSLASSLAYRPDIRCPSGTVRIEVFCAASPVGSYSDGITATLCPMGQYQDMKQQAVCKQCPAGTTTTGIGSIDISECLVEATISNPANRNDGSDDPGDGMKIGIGVSLSIFLLVLSSIAVVLVYKKLTKRKRSVSNSSLDLHITDYIHMQSKPIFNKDML